MQQRYTIFFYLCLFLGDLLFISLVIVLRLLNTEIAGHGDKCILIILLSTSAKANQPLWILKDVAVLLHNQLLPVLDNDALALGK